MKKILLSVAFLSIILASGKSQQRFVDPNNQQLSINQLATNVDEYGQKFIRHESGISGVNPASRQLRSEPWQDNLKEYNPFFTNAKEWPIPEMNFIPSANPQPAGDLNYDGFDDFVTFNGICADERTSSLDDYCFKSLIFYGNGTGGFDKQLQYSKIIPAGDLNGDGFGDAFIQEYEKECFLYMGSKDGFVILNSDVTYDIKSVSSINIDVNKDGVNDCVYLDSSNTVNVLYGSIENNKIANKKIETAYRGVYSCVNVDGEYIILYYTSSSGLKKYQFSTESITTFNNTFGYYYDCKYFDYADIDNDGKGELIAYGEFSKISIFNNFTINSEISELEVIQTNILGALIGDIDGNNIPEFLISNTGTQIANISLDDGGKIINSVLLNFPIQYNFNNASNKINCQIYDYNNNGKDDLIIRSYTKDKYIYKAIRTDNNEIVTESSIEISKSNYQGIETINTCNLGDINGDGLDEIALYDLTRIDIYSNGDMQTPAFTILPESDNLSVTTISAGDLNNDGFSDWIVGFRDVDNFKNSKINIYYGGSNISTTPAKQINIVNSLDITLDENAPTPEYGFNIIGSVDGDNYPEVIMFNTSDRDKNKVFIFKGAETFPDKPTTIMDFASNFGDVNIKSESDNGYIGSSAISLGDINNDGINDFVIADCLRRGADYNGINGCLFVFYGKTDLQFTTPEKILYNPNWDRSSSNFNLIYVYGMHLTSGDYNGDGVKDIAVSGTSFRDNNNNAAPGVDIYYGGNNISNIPNKRLYVKAKNNSTGEYSNLTSHGGLTTVPDIDGDKTDELIINLYKSDYSVGYLYLGSEGFNENPVAVINEATPLGGAISMNNYYYSRFPLPIAKFTNKNIPEFLSIRKDINYCGYTVALYRITDPANTAPFNIIIDNNTIKENSLANTKVGELDAIDHSILDYYTYKLIADGDGNSFDNELFSIEDNALYAKQSFDFEAKSSYNIFVEVTDASNATFQKQLVVNVEDVNEAPTNLTLSNNVVAEDAAIGTEIGVLSATDVDVNDVLTYTIADNENFKVEGDKLVTKSTFDYETKSEYKVVATVTDSKGAKVEKEFTITVTDKNEVPTNFTLSNNVVAEDVAIGTEVGTLSATDVDANDVLAYTIAASDNFKVEGDRLVTKSTFDFETKSEYKVTVTVTDAAGLSDKKEFTITITNVNEAPTALSLSNNTIAENATFGTEVGTLSATDVDANDVLTYTIATNSNFEVKGSKLVTKATFNFEIDATTYKVIVTATDNAGLKITKEFSIIITNVNEAPTALTLSANTVAENSTVGTVVGTLSATDVDANDVLTYKIVASDNFKVEGDKLVTKSVFDFETITEYKVNVIVTDKEGLKAEKEFTINVANTNEAPTALALSNNVIAEDVAVGTVVGVLSATDVDVNDVLTYTIADNDNLKLEGDKLITKSIFDYETKSEYKVVATATDKGGLKVEKEFTITITNINEAPTALSLSNNVIAEYATIGTEVGVLSATDVDANDVLTYTIDDNENFKVEGDKLVTKSSFDFETKSEYKVVATVTDSKGAKVEKEFTITVTDKNEVPTNFTLSNSVFAEDASVGTVVGVLSATDVDANDVLTYTIADNENFKVEGDKLVTKSTFDYETKSEYKVIVTVTDKGGLKVEKEFTITITEVKTTAIGKAVNANVNLYPNPAVTTITIETSVLINRVDIVNILGNVVYSQTVNATNTTIDISNLQSGIYNIKGYTLEGVITKKFVKR